MPIMECDKHGWENCFYGISKDIQQNISEDRLLRQGDVIEVNAINIKSSILTRYFLSTKTIEVLGISKYILDGDKETEDFYHLVKPQITGICVSCFEEYNEKYRLELTLNFTHLNPGSASV